MNETSGKKPEKAQKTRYIGIDFGMARIGVALSDESKMIASPLFTIRTERRSEDTVAKMVEEIQAHAAKNNYSVATYIVGMPLMMSGKKGHIADEVTDFIALLQNLVPVPVLAWDERLTTVQAERSLLESSLTRKRRAAVVDTVAATIILQNYLDSL